MKRHWREYYLFDKSSKAKPVNILVINPYILSWYEKSTQRSHFYDWLEQVI